MKISSEIIIVSGIANTQLAGLAEKLACFMISINTNYQAEWRERKLVKTMVLKTAVPLDYVGNASILYTHRSGKAICHLSVLVPSILFYCRVTTRK
jgi:hypothetical protein